jgi:tRNA-Thr(GGU) m(6)t(6)A37 methyltransferase TsaA
LKARSASEDKRVRKNEMEIVLKPIGIIHSPYEKKEDIPIQGVFKPQGAGTVEVFKEYETGLQDVEGFSHLVILYYFHKSKDFSLLGKPFLEDKLHGIFAIRSPHRPNHLGVSVVRLLERKGNLLEVGEIDVLDGTPVLDIKPYVPKFDARKDIKIGWLEGKLTEQNGHEL